MRLLMSLGCLVWSSLAIAGGKSVSSGTVSLVQVKNGTAEVPATIAGVTGSVDLEAGTGTLTIPVNAWDSALEIRDNNIRGTFFQADANPTATFTLESLTLADGQGAAKGTLTLYSGSVPVEATVKVTSSEDGSVKVETVDPFNVSISALGLGDALTAVMKLCAHQSVDDAVKVGVSLELASE